MFVQIFKMAVSIDRSYAEVTNPRNTAKPVFIKEYDFFGLEKPSKEQYITHSELYGIIG